MFQYSYFAGTTLSDMADNSKYMVLNDGSDLTGWADEECTKEYAYICEFTGRSSWSDIRVPVPPVHGDSWVCNSEYGYAQYRARGLDPLPQALHGHQSLPQGHQSKHVIPTTDSCALQAAYQALLSAIMADAISC